MASHWAYSQSKVSKFGTSPASYPKLFIVAVLVNVNLAVASPMGVRPYQGLCWIGRMTVPDNFQQIEVRIPSEPGLDLMELDENTHLLMTLNAFRPSWTAQY